MPGRTSFASYHHSSQSAAMSPVVNPIQYTTTLHIADPIPNDIVKSSDIHPTSNKNAPGSSAQMAETYASFDDTYNVKTNFIRRIYTLLCMQLALTCMMCYLFYTVDSIKNYVLHSPGMLWTSIIMTFVFLIVGSPPCYGRHHPMNLFALLGFTLCESYLVGYTCLFYNSALILMACGITLSTFVGLTAYVMYTKADFNFLGAGLYSCLWIMIIGSFISAFLPNMPVFNVAMAILGCITAVGYILYDTSEIINRMEIDEYVFACMSLYIDIIMLFLNLLQLLSGGKNDD